MTLDLCLPLLCFLPKSIEIDISISISISINISFNISA